MTGKWTKDAEWQIRAVRIRAQTIAWEQDGKGAEIKSEHVKQAIAEINATNEYARQHDQADGD